MNTFQEYFSRIRFLDSVAGVLEYVDVPPSTSSKKGTILFIFGWGETLRVEKNVVKFFSEKGYRVITVNFEHLDRYKEIETDAPAVEYAKAIALRDLISTEGLSDIHILGHSEGAIVAAFVCYLFRPSVNSLVLVAPAGFVEHDSFTSLTFRFSKSLCEQVVRSIFRKSTGGVLYFKELLGYISRNPIQSLDEVLGISSFNVRGILKKIIKRGVEVHIIAYRGDVVFPKEAMESFVEENPKARLVYLEGEHDDLNKNPHKILNVIHNP